MSSHFVDHLPGRWLRDRPRTAGVYVVRYGGRDVLVTYFDPEPLRGGVAELEFFHAPGDESGQPTRGDDQKRYAEARARGWRPESK